MRTVHLASALVIALLGSAVAGGPAGASEAGEPSGASEAESAGSSLPADGYDMAWTVVEDPLLLRLRERETETGQGINLLAGGPGAFVAALDCRQRCPDLLRSPDGITWERITVDGPGDAVVGLTFAHDEFLALVREGPDPYEGRARRTWHVYRSPDGREWRRQTVGRTGPGDVVSAVTAGPDGLIAVGCEMATQARGHVSLMSGSSSLLSGSSSRMSGSSSLLSGSGPTFACRQGTIWSSRDGGSWTREQPRAAARVALDAVASTADRIVAAGSDGSRRRDGAPADAIVSRTPNGAWKRAKANLPGGAFVVGLTSATDSRLLATVRCCDFGGLIVGGVDRLVSSGDGLTWRDEGPILSPGEHGTGYTLSLASSGPLATAAGFREDRAGRRAATLWWRAADGWQRQPLLVCPTPCDDDRAYRAAIGPGGRVAAIGGGVAWLGQLVPADAAAERRPAGPVRHVRSAPAAPTTVDGAGAYLLAGAARPDRCVLLRGATVSQEAPGATAGIECQVRDGSVRMIRHFLFPDDDTLAGWWQSRPVGAEPGEPEPLAACARGEPSSGRWPDGTEPAGAVACSTTPEGTAFLHWTTDDALVGSEAWARQGGLGALTRWFATGRVTPTPGLEGDPAAGRDVPYEGRGSLQRTALEDELLALVDASTCRPWRETDGPFELGALAAIQCDRPARAVSQLALFAFPDAVTMSAFWAQRVASIDAPLPDRAQACADGRPGLVAWEHGEVACYVDRGVTKLRWTDGRSGTYGVADARDRDLRRLFRFAVGTVGEELAQQGPDAWPSGDMSLDARIPPTRPEQDAYLLARTVDPDRCKPITDEQLRRDVEAGLAEGAIAGIRCLGTSPERVDTLYLYLFATSAKLEGWWSGRLEDARAVRDSGTLERILQPRCGVPRDREVRRSNETAWTSSDGSTGGRLACLLIPDEGLMRAWTQESELIGAFTHGFGPRDRPWFEQSQPDAVQG